MSQIYQIGEKLVFGVKPILPIRNCPPGRRRIRLRNTNIAWLFIKTDSGIRKFAIKDCGDHWEPVLEQASNIRQ